MEYTGLLLLGLYALLAVEPEKKAGEKIDEENLPVSKDVYLGTEELSAKEIVAGIVNGVIVKINYRNYNYLVTNKPNRDGSTFIDQSRELKDIATEIVVNAFLESAEANFNFLKRVYGIFEESINYYLIEKGLSARSIFIVYKGGNVLRIISNEFLRGLPGVAAHDIGDYYQKFFKRSDADFSIYIDPTIEAYDNVYDDMVVLSYILQRKLRMEFEADPVSYFDIYKYTLDYQRKIFQPYFDRIREAKVFKDSNNVEFYNKKPVQFVFGKASIVSESPIDSNYISVREYIGEKDVGIQFVDKESIVTRVNETSTSQMFEAESKNTENGEGISSDIHRTFVSNKELGGDIVVSAVGSLDLQDGGYGKRGGLGRDEDLDLDDDIENVHSVKDDYSNQISMFYLDDDAHSIYVQSNGTLDFKAGGRVKFALVRSKINFNIYIVQMDEDNNVVSKPENLQIGGELIDVSIPHRLDDKIHHFFDNMGKYVHKYELKHKGDLLTFTSYSLIYLIEDLEYILFEFVQKPWGAPKYEKRVNRLFYLYMIDIFNKLKTNEQREEFLQGFDDMIDRLSNSTNLREMDGIVDEFKVNHVDELQYLHINDLLEDLKGLNQVIVFPEDLVEYRKFLKVLKENSQIITNSFQNVDQYCSIDGSIRLKAIYDVDLKSLV